MYRTIDAAMWNDPKFRSLPAPGRLMFIYLITNPHAHVSGIYYLPTALIVHESGLKQDTLDTIWDTLSNTSLAFRDADLELVWVVNMLRYQGKGKQNALSAANQLRTLHNSSLIKEYLKHYPQVKRFYKDRVSDRVVAAPLQEQEQEQEQEKEAAPLPDEVGADGQKITAETVYRAYPKHAEPEPSRKAIVDAVRYLRKKGTPTPWAWLLGRVNLYADARRALEAKSPGASQFTPRCAKWMKAKRYEEDPADWAKETCGLAVGPTRRGSVGRNGTHGPVGPPGGGSITRTQVYGKVD